MSLPIRVRLTLWYTALLAAILLAAGLFLALRLRAELTAQTDRALTLAASEISVDYKAGGESEFRDVTDASLAGLPRERSAAQIYGRDGRVLQSAGDLAANRPILTRADVAVVLGGSRFLRTASQHVPGGPYRIVAVRLPASAGGAVLGVATSLAEVGVSVRRLVVLLLITGPLALAAAAVGGWWLAGRSLRPVARMTAEANEIGAHRLTDRIEVPSAADELRALAVTLNGMIERLAAAMERQRRFVADASHELRTPLAVMRAELDLGLSGATGAEDAAAVLLSAREEVDRMAGIVNDMLLLAQADEGRLDLDLEPLELKDVASAVVARIRPYAESRHVLVNQAGAPGPVLGDRSRLEHVMTNLLDNGVKHAPGGSTLTVSTWRSEEGSGFTVQDHGPGMTPDVLEHVFDRFFRAEAARDGDGSGLGLAICREIVIAHGGRVWATSEPGRGSSFSFVIPTGLR